MFIHPLVRLWLLLIFATALALGALEIWQAALVLLALLFDSEWPAVLNRAWMMSKRLRWFYLSIAILFAWFTPGRWLIPAWQSGSPTLEGMQLALDRILILAMISVAVSWLLHKTHRDMLMGAIYAFSRRVLPWRPLAESIAVRLSLTLSLVAETRPAVRKAKRASSARQRLLDWVEGLERPFLSAFTADDKPQQIPIPFLPPADWRQWLLPGGLLLLVMY